MVRVNVSTAFSNLQMRHHNFRPDVTVVGLGEANNVFECEYNLCVVNFYGYFLPLLYALYYFCFVNT
jgi:hypothetical protein